jgi:trehalose 6-phosphate synthase
LVIRYAVLAALLVGATIFVIPPFAASFIEQWSERDVESRSLLAFNSALDEFTALLEQRNTAKIEALFERMALDERLLAVGFCDDQGRLFYATKAMPKQFTCAQAILKNTPGFSDWEFKRQRVIVSSFPVVAPDARGHVILINDLSFAERRSTQARVWAMVLLIGFAALAAVLVCAAAILLGRHWLQSLRHAVDQVRLGRSDMIDLSETAPFGREFRRLLRDLEFNNLPGEGPDVEWSPAMLRHVLAQKLPGAQVIVVSNREPYIHNHDGDKIVLQRPASGLVAALEPIMRACGGTWVAHGSGSADRDMVDRFDHIGVPPGEPSYILRRVWLSDEEQNGYYYGFANEGLWPLCHMAFVRPQFRESDWAQYRLVNERYAQVIATEAKGPDPIIFVQDYHFALLPGLLRAKLPRATIITFWHIPWPNPEMFGICPWKEEILAGLLGSSVIGFHTRFHCNNFLDTVDRFVEARNDREHSIIISRGGECLVRPYPISIEWPPAATAGQRPVAECRVAVRQRLGLPEQVRLGVGIERFDYTKGILDRLRAIDAFLCDHPEWKHRLVFLQVAAPTRGKLATYNSLQQEAAALVREINARHGSASYMPIVLIVRHYEPAEIFELFRAADFCVVSSLHDGMNLVAKEFIAARDDMQGVLLLSQFAGASRELPEALIVNPFDIRSMTEALERALSMPQAEQRERMQLMRDIVRLRNVYRWAGQMLLDAAELRTRSRIMRMVSRPEPSRRLVAARSQTGRHVN